ncbi:MAG TPA: NAD(P)H-binding protein [Polyangiaceae bacterium]
MKVVLFGATGMVGQGVLRECLLASDVEVVLAVGRSKTGKTVPKLRELVHADFSDFAPVAGELTGYDACFYCLGVSSAGMNEADYTRVTYAYTMAAATVLAEKNPAMTFVFVSGAGTDATEKGTTMWARVKGKTENAVARLPFEATYMFRPGFIQAMQGVVSRTALYRALYVVLGPLFPVWKALFPGFVTTTENVGRAMLQAARSGAPKHVLDSRDINALAATQS